MRPGAGVLRLGVLMAGFVVGGAASADPCREGARIVIPTSYLLAMDAAEIGVVAITRVGPSQTSTTQQISSLPEAVHLPEILAERAALLPDAAQDLPALIMAAQLDLFPRPVYQLSLGMQSILTPDLIAIFDRHGLGQRADVLRQAMATFPEWATSPGDRRGKVFNVKGEVRAPEILARIETLEPA